MKNNLIPFVLTTLACACVSSIALAQDPTLALILKSGGPVSQGGAAQQTASTADKPGGGTGGRELSAADRAFMQEAATGGMKEVAMGEAAEGHAQSGAIKAFAGHLVNDHTKANNELMTIAQNKGVQLKTRQPSANWTSDQQFVSMMIADHQKTLAAFQKEAKNGSDPDVKTFAQKNAAVIARHLQMAKRLGNQTGGGNDQSTGQQ